METLFVAVRTYTDLKKSRFFMYFYKILDFFLLRDNF